MRIVDIFFAFPFYVMVIVLVFIFGSGEFSIYIAIAAVSWVSYAKIVRGEVLVAKQQDYVVAARLGGMSHLSMLVRHIGPNVLSQAIIYAMSDIVMDIMAIVTLGYLGLGIAPPTAEWGSMITTARSSSPRSGSRQRSRASWSSSPASVSPGSATACRICSARKEGSEWLNPAAPVRPPLGMQRKGRADHRHRRRRLVRRRQGRTLRHRRRVGIRQVHDPPRDRQPAAQGSQGALGRDPLRRPGSAEHAR